MHTTHKHMKRNIAIIAGGYSSEHDVSLRSAAGISSWLDRNRYNVYLIDIEHDSWTATDDSGNSTEVDKNDFSFTLNGEKVKPDYAYITIHGAPGENGQLQGYFDMIALPYSTSGVLVESMTYSKFTTNQYLKGFGVAVAESMVVRREQRGEVTDQQIVDAVGLPCFVKPNGGGSSFGTTKVKTAEALAPALEAAFNECPEVMIEAFMEGTELTCGCYKTKLRTVVLPPTEVVPLNEFFDYDAKYNGQVSEITPARISADDTLRVQQLTSAIYDILHANGIIRVDYILSPEGKLRMLEVNTTPGMTATSFIPQEVKANGQTMQDVLTEIIENQF